MLYINEGDADAFQQYCLTDFHWRNTVSFIGDEAAKEEFAKGPGPTKEARAIGKTLGLALCYGGTKATVQRAYPTYPEAKCQMMVDRFFQANSVLKKYLKKNIEKMHQDGYVKTVFGRKLYIYGAGETGNTRESWRIRNGAENDASNYPIQGTGAEVIRIMLINGGRWIEEGNLSKDMGNNVVKPYMGRIVIFDTQYEGLEEVLDQQPNGNTKVLFGSVDNIVAEYDRLIAFNPTLYKDFKVFF